MQGKAPLLSFAPYKSSHERRLNAFAVKVKENPTAWYGCIFKMLKKIEKVL